MAVCERLRAQFNDFLDGTLGAGQAQELNAHLQECGACRAEYHALKATQEMVRRAGGVVEGGAQAKERVMSRFRQSAASALERHPSTPAAERTPAWERPRLLASWRARLLLGGGATFATGALCLFAVQRLRPPLPSPAGAGGPILIATASCGPALPSASDLDQMISAHAVQSFAIQNGSAEMQQEALDDANSRLLPPAALPPKMP